MLDKKDTTLIKLDCKSKDKVYDMLFGKADACLKNAKTVALLYLGSPYYMTRALEEYNIEEVNRFTIKDFKFIYEPFENAERAKIWYVDSVKDTFKECDMKFDCIIMNPPYQRNLHLKILAESIKHLKDDKSVCVNLSPVTWADKRNICHPKGEWRKKLNGKINSLDFIEHRNANDMFGTGNAIEYLAITTYKNNGTFDIINYGFTSELEASLFKKINIFRKDGTIFTLNQAIGKSSYGSGNGKNVIRKKYDVPIHKWHGGKTCSEAVLNTKVSDVEKCAATFRFNSENERINFINSLDTTFMNWYYKMFIVPSDCRITGYMFRMEDYSKPWDDTRFYKFFNITPEEQKIIESTMEKYK